MTLYALFYYKDDEYCDIYDFMTVCDSIEACFTVIRNIDNFNTVKSGSFDTDKVFIGNRSLHDGRIAYIIEEVTLNNY